MRGNCPGCVIERWIGATGPGAVAVGPGRLKVREPRLPKLRPPPPGRASAVAAPRKSAQIAASTAKRKGVLVMSLSQRRSLSGRAAHMGTRFRGSQGVE